MYKRNYSFMMNNMEISLRL